MAKIFRLRTPDRLTDNTGFGDTYNGRFIDNRGFPNVKRKGINFIEGASWYHILILMPFWQFILWMIVIYMASNMIFAVIYMLIGIEHINGVNNANFFTQFADAFFFSVQTFTTTGYGHLSPIGFWTNLVASFEAFFGLLYLAMATGLFFGKFSRPQAFLRFSKHAIIAPYQGGRALMFRLVPYKDNTLTDVEVNMIASIELEVDGENKIEFFNLKTEMSQIVTLSLNWTVVHKIDEESPFYKFTEKDFQEKHIEIIVHIRAFDEIFSSTVVQRHSYISQNFEYGVKFEKMYEPNSDHTTTHLFLNRLDNTYRVDDMPMT